MKKLRPFLALLLACWLLAAPALADGETGGDTSESPPVSDSAPDDSPSFSEEAPPEDPPVSENTEREDPPDASGDTSSSSGNPSDAPEDAPPVVDDTPGTADPDPIEPDPVDPAPETPVPVDPAPVDPVPEVPETPVVVPEAPVDPPPVYPIPDMSVVSPGLQETPSVIYEAGADTAPAAEDHQVFTITTIPEFALAALESDPANTMAQVVRDLFGTYTPRVQTVTTYVDGEPIAVEEQYVPGVAGMDWEWIAGFTVFLLMLYCLFRLLGGSVKYG